MADKTIEEKVKDIIVEQLGVNPEQVTPQASFIEDLGADSLDIVELVMAFEEEFSVDDCGATAPVAISKSCRLCVLRDAFLVKQTFTGRASHSEAATDIALRLPRFGTPPH